MYIFLVSLGMISRVGINGFGRIGRVIFRTCLESKDLEITAINDPAVDIEYICYLIKFDSTHGKLHSDVSYSGNEIFINGRKIKVFGERLPSNIPWKSVDVHYVVEASGMFTSLDKASGHLTSESVRQVIVTAPTIDVPMLILGVNMEQINTEQKVISCASSTLYCLAPIIKILEDNYGVAEGFITSIHAMTPSLKPLDGLCLRGKHWRDHRSIHQNIIPAATGACKALGKIIPQVKDKMTGLAFRVPIVNVSVLDITIRLKKATTIQDIIKCVHSESKTNMKNIIKISKDQEVSSDFLGDQHSCIFDINSSLQLNPNFFKLICWYENEYSYACRVIDSMKYLEENHYKLKTISKIPLTIESKRSIPMQSIPYFNKEYVRFNCQIQNPKILLSNSQDTGFKESSSKRQVTQKRSFSYRNSESNQLALCKTKKRNEIFKVWNDVQTSRPVVRDKNLFYQSCMSLRSSYMRCNHRKTQHRLEEVKKEFSKMVNMTENLLKKSNQKCENNILDGKSIDREEITEKILNYDLNIQLPDASDQEVSRDAVLNASISRIYDGILKTSKPGNSNSFVIKNESHNNCKEIEFAQSDKNIDMIWDVYDFNKISDKNLRNLSQNNPGEENIEEENSVKANDEVKLQENIILEKPTSDIAKSSFVPIQLNSEDSYTNKAKQEHLDLLNVKLSKNMLQYDKVSEPNTSCRHDSDGNLTNDMKANFIKPNESIVKDEIKLYSQSIAKKGFEDKNVSGKKAMRKKIIEGIIRKLSVDTTNGDRTRSPSIENTVTTISNEGRYLDLYDKLDSASATDSDNSFEINERRSQIIDITDLTSSAEDLDRLDKICRIIEISDDLSNRLFSVLDNTEPNIKKKKWSFKDLCDRLKLDEFCNTVFGPSTSH